MPPSSEEVHSASAIDSLATVLGNDPTWERLEDQIGWYDRKSGEAQRWYKRLKLLELLFAAALPPIAGLGGGAWLVSIFSTAIVVLEGTQHLFQYQEHWITYRSTCEALRHERYLYLAHAGPYAVAGNAHALLADRIEGLISQEHAKWAASHDQVLTAEGKADRRPSQTLGSSR